MSRFYTNVTIRGDKVLYRGYEDGERVEGGIDYRPTLFVSTNKSSKYHTIHGHSVESFQPDLCPIVETSLSDTKA